jgi:hypothetical protein
MHIARYLHHRHHQYGRIASGVCALLLATAQTIEAQSQSDLSAYNALIVSPVGGLPPIALDDGRPLPERASLALTYGQWRFDIDDAIHHNLGLTLSHRLGSSNTSVSATGAYLSASCDCSGWTSGGVSIRSILWSSAAGTQGARLPASLHFAADLSGGGAQFEGVGHAVGYSVAADGDIGGSIPFRGSSRIALAIVPGLGWGRLNSSDESGDGFRPMYGVAMSWKFKQGVSIDLGLRRIVLKDGPTELGAGVSWRKL